VDNISSFNQRNPAYLTGQIGERLRILRLAKGWTQEELSERAGVAVSTLKLLESTGRGSIQRLARIAVTLGVDAELRNLFAYPTTMESIDAVKRSERQRAPRRKKKGDSHGT